MSIHDVVLFVSSMSQVCISPVQFIKQHNLPVRLVRLDTPGDRQAAQNGKYFQIHAVPTLLVTYSDGNIQLFAGQEKILLWLQQALASRQPSVISPPVGSTPPNPRHVTTLIEDDDSYEEPSSKTRVSSKFDDQPPAKGKKPRKKPRKKTNTEEQTLEPKKSGGLYGGKPRRSQKKSPPVQFTEDSEEDSNDEGDIVFINDTVKQPRSIPPPQTSGLITGPASNSKSKSQMTSLYDIAKQMEKDRQHTLGYREDDLQPRT